MSSEAIQNLREALKHSPDNIFLRLHLADTLMQHLLYKEAEEEYRVALQQQPQNDSARHGLAKAYFHQENYSTALIILEELLAKKPDNIDFLLLSARALLREGSTAEAHEQYQRVIVLDPQHRDEELDEAFRGARVSAHGDEATEDDSWDEDAIRPERPSINFDDVGGMSGVKEEIELKIIHPLKFPELYKAYGKSIGGGILLYGPPGCGKTHIARATAGQVQARFMSIGINDILDMWIGNSERNMHEVFETARRNAPCVLFFDEVDALGANRTDMRSAANRHVINQFLSELDGVEASNEGVLILGATNAPWHLDPAFRRPGRFDRIIFVEPPDVESRKHILEILLRDKPTQNIDLGQLAKKTKEFSGADLNAMLDIAIEEKLKASMKTGLPEPLTTKDLLVAAKRARPSTKEWFNTAKNYAMYANDSGLYDGILDYLKIKR